MLFLSSLLLLSMEAIVSQPVSYLQIGLRPPPPAAPTRLGSHPSRQGSTTPNSFPRSFATDRKISDSLDAGLFRQYLASGVIEDPRTLFDVPSLLENEKNDHCDMVPNGTANAFHVYQCDDSRRFTVHNVAMTNYMGEEDYPLDIQSYARVFVDLTANTTRRIDKLSVSVAAYKRSKGWLGCGWIYLPSFSLLNNEDLCRDENPSCPISEGRQVLEIPVEPSAVFARLLRLFHVSQDVYQFIVRLQDPRNPFEDLLCLAIQTKIQL